MNIEEWRERILSLGGVSEGLPFGDDALVFKVGPKIFLIIGLATQPQRLTFKARPEHGEEYRSQYPALEPGYHSNKKHWNSLWMDGTVAEGQIWQWIIDSYRLVRSSLSLKQQAALPPE